MSAFRYAVTPARLKNIHTGTYTSRCSKHQCIPSCTHSSCINTLTHAAHTRAHMPSCVQPMDTGMPTQIHTGPNYMHIIIHKSIFICAHPHKSGSFWYTHLHTHTHPQNMCSQVGVSTHTHTSVHAHAYACKPHTHLHMCVLKSTNVHTATPCPLTLARPGS